VCANLNSLLKKKTTALPPSGNRYPHTERCGGYGRGILQVWIMRWRRRLRRRDFQSGKGGHVGPPLKIVWRPDDRVYCPTLEELIEACGTSFENLSREPEGDWYVNNIAPPERSFEKFYHGSTPSEAIAHLWLALNKSDVSPSSADDQAGA
jgi:hypothetical protein